MIGAGPLLGGAKIPGIFMGGEGTPLETRCRRHGWSVTGVGGVDGLGLAHTPTDLTVPSKAHSDESKKMLYSGESVYVCRGGN